MFTENSNLQIFLCLLIIDAAWIVIKENEKNHLNNWRNVSEHYASAD